MNTSLLLYWAPRVLAIVYAGFLAMFAFGTFGDGRPLRETLPAFAIHLAPAGAALVMLLVAWRYEVAGALLFAAAGTWYAIITRDHLSWVAVIAGPLFVIAGLFAVSAALKLGVRAR